MLIYDIITEQVRALAVDFCTSSGLREWAVSKIQAQKKKKKNPQKFDSCGNASMLLFSTDSCRGLVTVAGFLNQPKKPLQTQFKNSKKKLKSKSQKNEQV